LIPNALQPAEIDEVMLCQLLGRAIVLVREDQLSLAIGRRGQNVRLASKLVGWDIEIMTSEELDELIEKAVAAFSKIEGVDTDLAEKLVEQGILSYDDLSVMEISDLVNTIEGLAEEQAVDIVGKAETLAEEQAEELPRRKGARPPAQTGEISEEAATTESGSPVDPSAPTLDELLGGEAADVDGDAAGNYEADGENDTRASEPSVGAEETDEAGSAVFDDLRDFALAAESSGRDEEGREVTSPPSNADQDETSRIVTEAVTMVDTDLEGASDDLEGGPNSSQSSSESLTAGKKEGRETDMHQP
jgi:N utilization substance protein A